MNPHLTTSAIPATRSGRASVARASRSQSTATGSWKLPTRFFPSVVLIPVLPPTAASTIPSSVVGTLTRAHAAQPGCRDEAGQVGGRSPADPEHGVGAGEAGGPSTDQQWAATAAVLAASASGTSIRTGSSPASASAERPARPGGSGSADESRRPAGPYPAAAPAVRPGARADQHRIGSVGPNVDPGGLSHGAARSCRRPGPGSGRRCRPSRWRPRRTAAARSFSRASSRPRTLPSSSGRAVSSPTRLTAAG